MKLTGRSIWYHESHPSFPVCWETDGFPTVSFDEVEMDGGDTIWICNEISPANGLTENPFYAEKRWAELQAASQVEIPTDAPAAEVEVVEVEIEWVNLTPHQIDVITEAGDVLHISASGKVARLDEQREARPSIGGIAVSCATYGTPYLLAGDVRGEFPEPRPNAVFIVSGMMLAHFTHRTDVVAPGKAIRNEAGQIIGCDGFSAAS